LLFGAYDDFVIVPHVQCWVGHQVLAHLHTIYLTNSASMLHSRWLWCITPFGISSRML
jgi:hypothetical protein